MKRLSLLAAMLLIMAGMQTAVAQKMVVTMEDDTTVKFIISKVKNVTFEEAAVEPDDEHEYVDLALPSGTLWATCNVGANSPEEYGDYFAWGETEPKVEYSWSTYFDKEGGTLKKYNNNGGKRELDPEDDAATANWGNLWQLPSFSQITELYNVGYTTTEWTTQNGVNGMLITSQRNGKSIFLPAAGYRLDISLNNEYNGGYYWSRSLNTNDGSNAYTLCFNWNIINCYNGSREYGQSVRPVRVKNE